MPALSLLVTKINKLCGRPPQYAPPPPLQRKRAAAALSQAGRAGPDEPIRAIPAGRPAGRMYATDVGRQTDVRQHHHLMPPPGAGHNNC